MGNTQTQIENIHGQEIRVQVRPGDPAVPPLLMCNGIGTSLEALQPLVDALDDRIGVVRFDVPGVGGSATPARPYRMSGLAQTIHQLCIQLDYKQVDVFGISWGGGLAQQFAHQYPRFCRRLVLACTGTGMTMVPGQPRVLAQLLSGSRHRDAAKAAAVAPMLYGGSMRERPEEARDIFGDIAHGVSKVGYANQLLAMVGWTSLRWLSQVKQQTLLLFGDDDPIIRPINGRMIHWRMPHSKLVMYPGGHVDVIVNAETYAPIIGDFLLESPAVSQTKRKAKNA
ncbi:poly(3-hydroxyalkanoate) depolymerase [Antricoccus suffuscus]|uniref:Poly(3-hydroxyalkanoate) depolymerase n=1 Tax=Antricoccus suffuscus TaxID=1629062 RepID=A0A2T1A697_9ACTN|nr:poly(3-hydroxyalkanoate) depolymerase [Antricoccus suffuscus]PRZ44121.1 poly(3-hydroxyalkanoate) depolymerase [Antricoccus suffuscus]